MSISVKALLATALLTAVIHVDGYGTVPTTIPDEETKRNEALIEEWRAIYAAGNKTASNEELNLVGRAHHEGYDASDPAGHGHPHRRRRHYKKQMYGPPSVCGDWSVIEAWNQGTMLKEVRSTGNPGMPYHQSWESAWGDFCPSKKYQEHRDGAPVISGRLCRFDEICTPNRMLGLNLKGDLWMPYGPNLEMALDRPAGPDDNPNLWVQIGRAHTGSCTRHHTLANGAYGRPAWGNYPPAWKWHPWWKWCVQCCFDMTVDFSHRKLED